VNIAGGMRTTRREFLSAAAAVTAAAAVGRSGFAQADALEQRLAHDPERPQFHLLPAKNWMNDPNGPIYFNGRYHMFFQYNPEGPTWGNMSWDHAVSPDMLHWELLPVALRPTPGGPDSFGVFSGSAIAVGKRVYAVYTGTRHSSSELATIRDGANNVQESQCLAWSDDPMLIRWTKDPQPIVPRPPASLDITGFRDPSAFKKGDWYYMTVGSGIARTGGCVLLYRSRDMHHWEYLHELVSGTWDGHKTANPCDDGEMWECPEFFKLGEGHVLIYSTLGKVFWQSGALDEATMRFTPKKTGELDMGAYYAPKTQLDAEGRRILWGWIPERRSEAAMRAAGWSGMMSLPRELTLDADGTLRIRAVPQISALRGGTVAVQKQDETLSAVLEAANGEVLCTGSKDIPMEFSLRTGEAELLHVRYDPATRTMSSGGKQIVLEPGDLPRVHLYVDGSVIEAILGERIGDTQRFYYTGAAPEIAVSATGAEEMQAWRIRPISANRMTTVKDV
jgi:beta-fructofuranosidase